ncbi:Aste57867_10971 [Aphanomyces stellatus]|uniref:Aste57867_10971 protein n=1 Tax=Aphanomyces stellatus TaxID=120398 RepID=A0A485KS60_9STRA|nr:hypothetical protein As57867_010930 [Aphanomyces stellatus]VFT87839.1 Aste57867_10971 [Aphanomyces stellatus]
MVAPVSSSLASFQPFRSIVQEQYRAPRSPKAWIKRHVTPYRHRSKSIEGPSPVSSAVTLEESDELSAATNYDEDDVDASIEVTRPWPAEKVA